MTIGQLLPIYGISTLFSTLSGDCKDIELPEESVTNIDRYRETTIFPVFLNEACTYEFDLRSG